MREKDVHFLSSGVCATAGGFVVEGWMKPLTPTAVQPWTIELITHRLSILCYWCGWCRLCYYCCATLICSALHLLCSTSPPRGTALVQSLFNGWICSRSSTLYYKFNEIVNFFPTSNRMQHPVPFLFPPSHWTACRVSYKTINWCLLGSTLRLKFILKCILAFFISFLFAFLYAALIANDS